MRRQIQPEILDDLPSDDPRAIHSRRDLQKINALMGHAGIVTRALRGAPVPPRLLVELGSGDGTLLLNVARRIGRQTGRRAMLVDRHPSVSAATLDGFRTAGWEVEIFEADVFEWLCRPRAETADATIANLLLHHFRDGEIAHLLNLVSHQTTRFIACEPRRSQLGLAGVSALRLIGCNEVTLHDAAISVRGGFSDRELTALWPPDQGWRVTEGGRGLFSHALFAARDERVTGGAPPAHESPISAQASTPDVSPGVQTRRTVENASAAR
jgi:hypothetical protein